MNYEYAVEARNYEDFASGKVLYNQKGTTSFPARLISEIFRHCAAILEKQGVSAPYSIYDPLCGGAYSLTTLGFLHSGLIRSITASDIDEAAVRLAEKNLALLTNEGLEERIYQLQGLYKEFGKASHKEALESADRLKSMINTVPHRITTECFQADALKPELNSSPAELQNPTANMTTMKYDIVITDIPYGELVDWVTEDGKAAVTGLLQNLLPKLEKHSAVAVITPKKTKIIHDSYKRIDKFQIGKRQVMILQPVFSELQMNSEYKMKTQEDEVE